MRHVRGAHRSVPAALVALVTLAAGCTDDVDPPPDLPTPVERIDLSTVRFPRTPFCDALDPDAVAEALGGAHTVTDHYESGARRRLGAAAVDVVHEHGCTFHRGSGPARTTARAWVFVAPATPRQARGWLRDRDAGRTCSPAGELRFGSPGQVLVCEDDTRRQVSLAGLFGDAWLSCELVAPAAAADPPGVASLLEAAQRWCAAVATSPSSG